MYRVVMRAVLLGKLMNLGVAVMASSDTVGRARGLDLLVFQTSILQARFFVSGLEKTAPSAAAIVIGAVGNHVDEVFLAHHGFDRKPQVIGNGIAVAFSYDIARVLNREFDF